MRRLLSAAIAGLFLFQSVVTVDLRVSRNPNQDLLAPMARSVVSLDSILGTLNQIASGEVALNEQFARLLQQLPSLPESRKAIFTLNKLLLQPMPGASVEEFIQTKTAIIEAINALNDGFAQPALVAFEYLLKKRANPELEPLPHAYGIERVWGIGGTDRVGSVKAVARDIVKERLESTPLLASASLEELVGLASQVRRRLHAEGYQPHWCEHVQGADNFRFLQKSLGSHVPFILLDFEDAVAFTKKVKVRGMLRKYLTEGEFGAKDKVEPGASKKIHPGNKWIALRPNNLGTSFSAADFVWLRDNLFVDDPEGIYEKVYKKDGVRKRLLFDSITIPKAVHHDEVVLTSRILRSIERHNGIPLGTIKMGFLIEDPTSALATSAFALADPTTITENYGVADYTASTGGRPVAQAMYNASLWARKRTVVGSLVAISEIKPYGVDSEEAITLAMNAEDTLRESLQAEAAGMRGKWSINPFQADGIELAPWPFHESGMTRKPLGNWEGFDFYPMEELERRANESIPLVERQPAIAKAVKPQRTSIVLSADDFDSISKARVLPFDQLTLDVNSWINESGLTVASEKIDQLIRIIKRPNSFNSRLALLLDAASLNENLLIRFGQLMDIFLEKGIPLQGLTLDNVTSPDQIRLMDAFLNDRLSKDPTMRPELFQIQARITSRDIVDHSLLKDRNVDFFDDAWQSAEVKWAAAPETWSLENELLYQIAKASDFVGTLIFAVPGLANDPIAKGHLLAAAKAAEVETVDASVLDDSLSAYESWQKLAEQMVIVGYRGQEFSSLDQVEQGVDLYSPSSDQIDRSLEVTRLYDIADVLKGQGAIGYTPPGGTKAEIVDEATAKIDRGVVEVAAVADLFNLDQRTKYLKLLGALHNIRVPFQIQDDKILKVQDPNNLEGEQAWLKAHDLPVIKIGADQLGADFASRMASLKAIARIAEASRSNTGRLPFVLVEGEANIGLGLLAATLDPEMRSRVVGVTTTDDMVYLSVTHQTDYEVAKAVVLWLKRKGYDKNHIKVVVDREAYVHELDSEDPQKRQQAVEQLLGHALDLRHALEGGEGNVYGLKREEGRHHKNVPFTASSMVPSILVSEIVLREIAARWNLPVEELTSNDRYSLRLTLDSKKDGSSIELLVSKGSTFPEGKISGFGVHTLVPFLHEQLNVFDETLPDGRIVDVSFPQKKSLKVGDTFNLPTYEMVGTYDGTASAIPQPREISDALIRGYAGFSEDRNLHHLNEEWANANLGSRIAHGVLTSSLGLDRLSAILASYDQKYTVVSEESSYKAKVPLKSLLSFTVEVVAENKAGDLKVIVKSYLSAVKNGELLRNKKPASINTIWLRPGEKKEPSDLVQSVSLLQKGEMKAPEARADYLSTTFAGVGPFTERPAPRFAVGDQMDYTWAVSEEKIRAFAAIFEGNEWADLLIGKAVSAKASSSMAPGSILLGSRVLEMARPIPVGQVLKVQATIVNLRKSSKGADVLTEHIKILDAEGNLLLHAQVTKQVQSQYEAERGSTSLRPEPISATEQGLPLTPQPFDVEKVLEGEPADLAAKPWVAHRGADISETVEASGANFSEVLQQRMVADGYPVHSPLMEFVDDNGHKESMTPFDFVNDVNRLAFVLQKDFGIQKGDRVALMMPNSYESRVSLLAVLTIGAIAVPLDVMYKDSELKPRFADAKPKMVIAASRHRQLIESVLREVGSDVADMILSDGGDTFRVKGKGEGPRVSYFSGTLARALNQPPQHVEMAEDGSDVAILQYKAGKEFGSVRGITISHRNLIAAVTRRAEVTFPDKWKTERAKVVYASPEYHTWGYITGVFIPLWAGQGSVTVADLKRESRKPYMDLLFELLTNGDGTHFFGVPSIFARLRNKLVKEQKVASPTYEVFVSAAAPLGEDVRLSFEALAGDAHFVQAYGQKEATVPVHAPVVRSLKPGSVGQPGQGVEILLVDPETQDRIVPLAAGSKVGELAILAAPEVVSQSVWQNPEATQALLQPFDGRAYRRTGDLAFVDEEGWVYILSRKDDLIIVSGNNVYPHEVEGVLEQHPAVEHAIVVGVADPQKGEVPVAHVQLKSGRTLDEEGLQAFARQHIAGYKIPTKILFTDAIPWKVAGSKKNRAAIRTAWKANFSSGANEEEAAAPQVVPMAPPEQDLDQLQSGARFTLTTTRSFLDDVSRHLAGKFSKEGRVSSSLIDKDQKAAEEYAVMESYYESAQTMFEFLESRPDLSEIDKKLSLAYLGEALNEIRKLLTDKPEAFGVSMQQVVQYFYYSDTNRIRHFFATVTNHQWLEAIGEELLRDEKMPGYLLDEERYETALAMGEALKAVGEQVLPPALTEEIHRKDLLVPEPVIQELAENGAFGLGIPAEFDGVQEDHDNMGTILGTIELSAISLGAAGSLITRPEITAKVILRGGTEEQKQELLPPIAEGQKMVTVLFTEPNYGSDLANIKMTGELDLETGEWVVNGAKMWGTFAGRADWGLVLVRTEKDPKDETGNTFAKGAGALSALLFDKPKVREDDETLPDGVTKDGETYTFTQPNGGTLAWKHDGTSGYRGMHSYSLTFENFRIPANRLIGKRGQGFFLIAKEGLAGGRVQTAARAIGLMRGAYQETVKYVNSRSLFPTRSKPDRVEADFGLTKIAVARMAMLIHGAQQYTFRAAELITEGDQAREAGDDANAGKGRIEASMAKFLFSRFANEVTRLGQQKHGGVGVAEEYPISRYAVDAQVLTIFEGAEEVLALKVIAPHFLRSRVKQLKRDAEAKREADEALGIAI